MFSKKLQEIADQILKEDVKVVSFDLFDTLVVRPCIEPTDIFRIVARRCGFGEEFVSVRKMAEQYARKKKAYYYDDVTIDEIYQELVALWGITEEKKCQTMECEMEVEYEYLSPRHAIKELFEMATKKGKKTIVVTDIYLPKRFIEKILAKTGILGYEKLYVSSHERLSKGTGRLFQKVIMDYAKEGIGKESMVHLGDNPRADVSIPQQLGIRSFHLPNTIGILNSKKCFKPLYEFGRRTDSTFLVGCLANYVFDDPFFPFNIDTVANGKANLFGSVLFGPILLCYTKWLIEKSIKNDIDKLFFVMRDGYLIQKIYDLIADAYDKVPDKDELYLSRMIRYYFNGCSANGLFSSYVQFEIPESMTVSEFLEKRIFLNQEEKDEVWKLFKNVGYIDIESPMGKPIQYYMLTPALQEILAKKVSDEVGVIRDYCNKKISEAKRPGIVDVGYRGSVSRFLIDEMDLSNVGLQLLGIPLLNQYVDKGYIIDTFYLYSFKTVKDLKILHHLMEDVISVQEGTAQKIEREGKDFKIIKKEMTAPNVTLTEIQDGVVDYIKYTFDIIKKDFKDFSFDASLFFDVLFDFLRRPNNIDSNIIKNLNFLESDFIKIQTDKGIYLQWMEEKLKVGVSAASNSEHQEGKTERTIAGKKKEEEPKNKANVIEIEKNKKNEENVMPEISILHLYAIKFCEKLHIINLAIALKKRLFRRKTDKKKSNSLIQDLFEIPMQDSLNDIGVKFAENDGIKRILVAGHMVSFDKGVCNFLNKLSSMQQDRNMILMSECIHLNEGRTKEKIHFPFFIVPEFLGKDRYKTDTKIVCSKKIKRHVFSSNFLKWGVDNLIKRHKDMEEDYAYCMVYYAEQYINKMLDLIQPEYVFLWNEFFALHHILKSICEIRKIKIIYLEFGSLPGTFSIERIGQMGESFPAKYSADFFKYPVSEEELETGKKIIDFLKDSKLNRNIQPINNNLDDIRKKLKNGRPIILYAGVNDYESGLIPYTPQTKAMHSPIYKSSEEALHELKEYAQKNDYNLIYKPHPIIEREKGFEAKKYETVITALDVDINDVIDLADVVVTILSQVSYTALIRGKPVVMLGYTQLKAKGCCYEIFEKKNFEKVMNEAVQKGFSMDMQKMFIKHVAQMIKYNLYNDLQLKPVNYGRSIEDAANYIFNCDDTTDWYLKNCR